MLIAFQIMHISSPEYNLVKAVRMSMLKPFTQKVCLKWVYSVFMLTNLTHILTHTVPDLWEKQKKIS